MPRFLFASDSLKGTLSSAQTAELLAAAAGLPLVAPAERDVTIDRSHADARLGRTSFTVMCDVDNPLLGPNGATRTFAPQKGEGRLDAQTAHGKVAAGIAAACGPMTLDFALAHATELYAQTAERLFSALAAGARLGASR